MDAGSAWGNTFCLGPVLQACARWSGGQQLAREFKSGVTWRNSWLIRDCGRGIACWRIASSGEGHTCQRESRICYETADLGWNCASARPWGYRAADGRRPACPLLPPPSPPLSHIQTKVWNGLGPILSRHLASSSDLTVRRVTHLQPRPLRVRQAGRGWGEVDARPSNSHSCPTLGWTPRKGSLWSRLGMPELAAAAVWGLACPSPALPPHSQLGTVQQRHQPTCHPQAPQATRNTQLSLLTRALLLSSKYVNLSFALNSQAATFLILPSNKDYLPNPDHSIVLCSLN